MLNLRDLITYKKNSCFSIPYDDFAELCKELYGEKSDVNFDTDGILVIAENGQYKDESDMVTDLSKALNIEIESVHITNADKNVYVISRVSF